MLIMTMKEVSVVIICLLLLSVVSACKRGEGLYEYSIVPSRSRSVVWYHRHSSLITTKAECIAAAEYNSKNNIDKNVGFDASSTAWTGNRYPRGCIYDSVTKKYFINTLLSARKTECSSRYKCILIAKKCYKCPKRCYKCPENTYSTGTYHLSYFLHMHSLIPTKHKHTPPCNVTSSVFKGRGELKKIRQEVNRII